MSAQHLTGWRLSAGDEHTVFDGRSERLVSVPCGGMSGRTFAEAADCTRLIAAAPELLAALEALARHDFDDRHDMVIYNEVCRRARAAIAKVRGAS